MKKAITILLAFIICFSFCACGKGSDSDVDKETEQSVESRIISEVEWKIQFQVSNQYNIMGWPGVQSYIQETGENKYHISGKVTCRDTYGDAYSGKFDADAEYNPDTDTISTKNIKIDKLYKQ